MLTYFIVLGYWSSCSCHNTYQFYCNTRLAVIVLWKKKVSNTKVNHNLESSRNSIKCIIITYVFLFHFALDQPEFEDT